MTDTLSVEWATITSANPSATTQQKLAILNATTVPVAARQDVSVAQVIGYLALNLKLDALLNYAAAAPTTGATAAQIVARNLARQLTLPNPPNFGTSDPTIYTTLSNALNAIAGDAMSGITSADTTTLLAMSQSPPILWWQANGFSEPIAERYLTAESPPLT